MTEGEKSSGKSWDGSDSDWFSVKTMKTLLIGQSVTREKYERMQREKERAYGRKLVRQRKSSGIDTIARRNNIQSCSHERNAKKPCNTNLKDLPYLHSPLSNRVILLNL